MVGRRRCFAAPRFAVFFRDPTIAADDEVRQAIGQLADKDDAVRQKALDSLLQTRDGRLSAALKSYQEGNLYLWKGRPAVGEQAAPDAAGKRTALLDPLTLEPLVEDAKPVVLPNGDLKEVELPRSDRKAVNAAVHALALWSNDFEKRVSAIQSAGENRAVELLPALEEIVTADPSAKIRHTARESIDVVQVDGVFPDGVSVDRLAAARDLGTLHSERGRNLLADLLAANR